MKTFFAVCIFLTVGTFNMFAQTVNTTILYDYLSMSPLKTIIGNKENINLVVGDNGVIMRSSDSGKTWEQLTQLSGYTFSNGAFFDKSNCFIVGYRMGVSDFVAFYSTDAGTTWTQSLYSEPIHGSSFGDVSLISLSITPQGSCIASTGAGTVISTDNYGKKWNKISSFDTQYRLPNVLVRQSGTTLHSFRGLVYNKSTDNGLTWKAMPNIAQQGDVTSAYVLDNKLSVAICYSGDHSVTFMESSDYGENWIVKSFDTSLLQVSKVIIIDSQTIIALRTNVKTGFYLSTDNGKTWVSYLEDQKPIQVLDVYISSPKSIIAVGTRKSMYLVDVPSKAVTVVSSIPNHVSSSLVFLLKTKPDSSILFCDSRSNSPCLSTDDGCTWSQGSHIFDDFSVVTDIHYRTNEHGYALIYGGAGLFMQTKDGGKTWSSMDSLTSKPYKAPYYNGRCFSFVDENTGIALVKRENNTDAIISTNDRGETWHETADTNYTFYYPQLKRYGKTDVLYSTLAIYNENKVVIGQEMVMSRDYGDTWIHRPVMDSIGISAFHVLDSNNIIVVGRSLKRDSSNHGRIFRTTDGGLSWLSLLKDSSFSFPWTIAVENNMCVVGGNEQDSVLVSIDYGFTWKGYYFSPTLRTDLFRYTILNSLIKNGVYYASAKMKRLFVPDVNDQTTSFVMKFNLPSKLTSTEDVQKEDTFNELGITYIRPNPAAGITTASFFHNASFNGTLSVKLYSSQGIMIRDLTSFIQKNSSQQGTITFDTEDLPAGMYLFAISCGSSSKVQLMPIIR